MSEKRPGGDAYSGGPQYKALLDSVDAGVVLLDPDCHRVLDANPYALGLLGRDAASLAGAACPGLLCQTGQARRDGRPGCPGLPLRMVERSLPRPGGTVPVLLSAKSATLDGRRVIVVTFTDISRLKQTELTYRDFFENAVEGIFQSSPDGRFLRVNPALVDILGYDGAEDMIASLTDLRHQLYVDPRDRDFLIDWLRIHGRITGFETRFYRKDGTIKWIQTAAREVRSPQGELLYIEGLNIDITEHKLAQEAFLDIQERYRSVFENSIDGVFLGTPDGRILAANQAACDIFSVNEQGLKRIGRPGIMAQDDPRFAAMCDELSTASNFKGELTGLRQDGERFPMELSAAMFRNKNGQEQITCIVRDITERRQAIEALKESEEKFRRTFDQSPIGASMLSLDFRFLRVNEAFCRITGYSEEELLRLTFMDITHPEDRGPDLTRVSRLVRGELDHYVVDKRYVHKNGGTIWIHLSAALIRDASGRPQYIMPLVQDITERKRAEEALAETQERLRNILTYSPAVIYSCTPDGQRLTFVSDNVRDLTGYLPSDLVSDPNLLAARLPDLDRRQRVAMMAEVLEKGQALCEYRMRTADGAWVWIREQARLVRDETGASKEIVGYLTDVTARRHIKEALEESELRYRAIVENQTDLVCRFTPDGRLTFVNEAYARYYKAGKEALLGTSILAAIPEEDRDGMLRYLAGFDRDHPVGSIEHRVTGSGGAMRWQQRSDSALFDEAGRIVEFQAVSRDVTDRVEAELAVARIMEEKENYRLNLEAVFRSIPEAIVTVDRSMRVIQANRALGEICCLGGELVPGRVCKNLTGSCKRACFHVLQKTLQTGEPVIEYRIECQSHAPGKVVIVNSSPLLDRENKFAGVVLVIRDITRLADLERRLTDRHGYKSIIGKSKPMQAVYGVLDQLAEVESTVLVTGESGTGKELVAEALHYGSPRASGPMIKVNCSALSESLLESELFGHVRGAFTGAIKDKVGRFEAAEGGTIFLDEIGDISPRIQLNLLRILERKEFERVGDSHTRKASVRVITATNVNLLEKIRQGLFREDLYYRLKVMVLHLPPLRERTEDIPLLTEHFVNQFRTNYGKNILRVSDDVMGLFMSYEWPGNVRELKYALEHACILCPDGVITQEHLPRELTRAPLAPRPPQERIGNKPRLRKEDILLALEKSGNNRAKAARLLGVNRRTLYRNLEKFSLG